MGTTVTRLWTVVVALVVASLVAAPGAAVAAGCSTPKGVYTGQTPWAQKLVDAPGIWPLSTGSGVLVAVVGTGVDASNAQFGDGQVLPEI
ncbi:MAG TPA: type VII secretion-associated serine protease mycosin, partial [Pseudonocardiaceae bacterium]|nr:type VII secretion-associated serine protease mycosin [Pseudonocardiaceae bacterium]